MAKGDLIHICVNTKQNDVSLCEQIYCMCHGNEVFSDRSQVWLSQHI